MELHCMGVFKRWFSIGNGKESRRVKAWQDVMIPGEEQILLNESELLDFFTGKALPL